MAWRDTLQDASFRGVPFEVLSTTDSNKQAVAQHSVPYTNGADLEPMGFDARAFNISAMIYGGDYETLLGNLENALRQPGNGEFIHPTRGSLTVVVIDFTVKHAEEEVETARVDIVFMEDGILTELFAVTAPEQPANGLADMAEGLLAAANDQLAVELAPITASPIFANKQRAVRLDRLMLGRLSALRQQVQGAVSSLQKAVNAPYAFASQLAGLCNNLIDLRGFDTDIMSAQWHSLRAQFKSILRLPNDGQSLNTTQQRDNQVLQHHLDVAALVGGLSAASQLFIADIDEPTLTPIDVEQICNTLRADTQQLITTYRQFNHPLTQADMAVVEALKAAAYQAQLAGLALIARKPPLIQRTVESDAPLRLIAHLWYGDHSRAEELLQLNPHINHPTFVSAGEVLNAYTQ